jgi:hypothetical protein
LFPRHRSKRPQTRKTTALFALHGKNSLNRKRFGGDMGVHRAAPFRYFFRFDGLGVPTKSIAWVLRLRLEQDFAPCVWHPQSGIAVWQTPSLLVKPDVVTIFAADCEDSPHVENECIWAQARAQGGKSPLSACARRTFWTVHAE